MSLIPEEHFKKTPHLNLAPMIDFLFLMLAFFATLALSRSALFDTKLDLVRTEQKNDSPKSSLSHNEHKINLTIDGNGTIRWISQNKEYPLFEAETIQKELLYQHQTGYIPLDKSQTKILLHIDRNAPWDSIAKLIFAIKQTGFNAYPVYQHKEEAK